MASPGPSATFGKRQRRPACRPRRPDALHHSTSPEKPCREPSSSFSGATPYSMQPTRVRCCLGLGPLATFSG
eukprot:13804269-Alexandrium_andersonii.AAC.1